MTSKVTELDAAAYRLGREVLGSVLLSFSHLLLRHAEQVGCRHLVFLARDGEFLMRCTERLATHLRPSPEIRSTYLYVSRQSTSLPALQAIDLEAIRGAGKVRAGTGSFTEVFGYLGVPIPLLTGIFARKGISPHAPCLAHPALPRLLDDTEFKSVVNQERLRQACLLTDYLAQMGLEGKALWVDIGWRGSIIKNIHKALLGHPTILPPISAFLGLWSETPDVGDSFPAKSIGLLSDMRRHRTVIEGAAWFAAFLLESICRANEGTALGYFRQAEQKVIPVLTGDSASRQAEVEAVPFVSHIQRGILDFIDAHGDYDIWSHASDDYLRQQAQRTLLRLACFPTPDEIRLGKQLVHTEGHAPKWSAKLITPDGVSSPFRQPRQWLAGLGSPWRTGYIAHTGGKPLAVAYLVLESLLLALPSRLRSVLAQLARQVSTPS